MKKIVKSDFDKSGDDQKKEQDNTGTPVRKTEASPFGRATGVSAQQSLAGRGLVLK